ncbi:unnamed protein product [Triticum turgidum subsp. durum]|uniref:Uncharacterized protein n=1 Tax=Triticum turgidum subsp. durum TaxID=4567 RepID=A0A9R1BAW5_TRITD|nr:unnamed protein product [Triticum turgidum subsp. durum]
MQMAAATIDAPVAAAPHPHPHAHGPQVPHGHGHPHPHHHMPQPRWVVLPYPPPPPMVAAPPPPTPQYVKHFAPQASVTPPPPSTGSGGNGGDENRTIWVGDLQYWMDENYLHSCFGPSGEVRSSRARLSDPALSVPDLSNPVMFVLYQFAGLSILCCSRDSQLFLRLKIAW